MRIRLAGSRGLTRLPRSSRFWRARVRASSPERTSG